MIDSNLVDYFLDKFRPDSVNLVGGEIFFHPDWKKHIWACSRYSEYLRIVTNGSLFMTPKGNETKVFKDFLRPLMGGFPEFRFCGSSCVK